VFWDIFILFKTGFCVNKFETRLSERRIFALYIGHIKYKKEGFYTDLTNGNISK
jgi:hypothetical protein